MIIDLEEIYIAVLLSGYKLKIIGTDTRQDKLHYFIEITEENEAHYTVDLWKNT